MARFRSPKVMVRRARDGAALALLLSALVVPGAQAETNNIFTVAGTSAGLSGDGGPATGAQINGPLGVTATSDGGYLVADSSNHRIRRVSPAGTITTVAGTSAGLSGDTGPATAAQLNFPTGVTATADGGYLVADFNNHRIRKVSAGGTITTVAGTTAGLSGDGGPATVAQFNKPQVVAVTADGGYLIADSNNHRIRRVSPAGTITTVAGTTAGLSGDGGPATAAQLSVPVSVATTADGGYLIAASSNNRIRKVSAGGTITTVAGTTGGLSGDGGPATAAQLSSPSSVAATADGGYLIADPGNHRIRRVSPAGTITTVAGSTAGQSGDGGPATAAQLFFPAAVAPTAEGGYLIAESINHRIRFVDADLRAPATGPQGTQGPTGVAGPVGPSGPAGPAGVGAAGAVGPPFDRLAVALAAERFSSRSRRRVTLRYASTRSATVEVRLLRGSRREAMFRGSARAGRNRIAIRAPRSARRYRLELVATTPAGQRSTDSGRLTVRR